MKVNISAATVLETIKEDAYITITDDTTGEVLFHGVRGRDPYVSTTLFETYNLVGLHARYGHKGMEMQLVVSLDVVPVNVLEENNEKEEVM